MSGFVSEPGLKYGPFVDFSSATQSKLTNETNRFHSWLWAQT
jgi:hypothetical protein